MKTFVIILILFLTLELMGQRVCFMEDETALLIREGRLEKFTYSGEFVEEISFNYKNHLIKVLEITQTAEPNPYLLVDVLDDGRRIAILELNIETKTVREVVEEVSPHSGKIRIWNGLLIVTSQNSIRNIFRADSGNELSKNLKDGYLSYTLSEMISEDGSLLAVARKEYSIEAYNHDVVRLRTDPSGTGEISVELISELQPPIRTVEFINERILRLDDNMLFDYTTNAVTAVMPTNIKIHHADDKTMYYRFKKESLGITEWTFVKMSLDHTQYRPIEIDLFFLNQAESKKVGDRLLLCNPEWAEFVYLDLFLEMVTMPIPRVQKTDGFEFYHPIREFYKYPLGEGIYFLKDDAQSQFSIVDFSEKEILFSGKLKNGFWYFSESRNSLVSGSGVEYQEVSNLKFTPVRHKSFLNTDGILLGNKLISRDSPYHYYNLDTGDTTLANSSIDAFVDQVYQQDDGRIIDINNQYLSIYNDFGSFVQENAQLSRIFPTNIRYRRWTPVEGSEAFISSIGGFFDDKRMSDPVLLGVEWTHSYLIHNECLYLIHNKSTYYTEPSYLEVFDLNGKSLGKQDLLPLYVREDGEIFYFYDFKLISTGDSVSLVAFSRDSLYGAVYPIDPNSFTIELGHPTIDQYLKYQGWVSLPFLGPLYHVDKDWYYSPAHGWNLYWFENIYQYYSYISGIGFVKRNQLHEDPKILYSFERGWLREVISHEIYPAFYNYQYDFNEYAHGALPPYLWDGINLIITDESGTFIESHTYKIDSFLTQVSETDRMNVYFDYEGPNSPDDNVVKLVFDYELNNEKLKGYYEFTFETHYSGTVRSDFTFTFIDPLEEEITEHFKESGEFKFVHPRELTL